MILTGSAAPGGSTTQVQYNSSGAFAGDSNFTWDATTGLALGKPLTLGTSGVLVGGTNTIEQYNSTNAQTFNLYNTRTDASNYERGGLRWSSNALILGTEKAGSGSLRAIIIDSGSTAIQWRAAGSNSVSWALGTGTGGTEAMSQAAPTNNQTNNGVTFSAFKWEGLFNPASGTPIDVFANLAPTINWGGTPGAGSYEALKIAVIETALPTGTNYLIRASAGGAGTTDKFSVRNSGAIYTADTTLLHTTAALTNGAGSSSGTLTNAPAVGNPTKWIPVDDNGTTRYIPAW